MKLFNDVVTSYYLGPGCHVGFVGAFSNVIKVQLCNGELFFVCLVRFCKAQRCAFGTAFLFFL